MKTRTKSRPIPRIAVAIFAAILIMMAGMFMTAALFPTDLVQKESVIRVETTLEVQPNPFFFFFMNLSAGGPKPPVLAPRTVHSYCSGFVVAGHLITAAHCVVADKGEKINSIEITSIRGEKFPVTVLRVDKEDDLAELSLTGVVPHLLSLHLASVTPKVGDRVTEIGHPAGIPWVVSRGEIVGFSIDQGYNIAALDTFGGNSGGPILNSHGQVIGVTHTILRGSRFTGIGTLSALRYFIYPTEVR